jgi:hypothetical protein
MQVNAYLEPHAKTAFDEYAAAMGLDTSELAKLLIVRELRAKRLARLVEKGRLEPPSRKRRGQGEAKGKVTAHIQNKAYYRTFNEYASKCGLSRSGAATLVMKHELVERWLDQSLSLLDPTEGKNLEGK